MERVRVRKVVWLKFNALTEQMFAFIMGTDVLSGVNDMFRFERTGFIQACLGAVVLVVFTYLLSVVFLSLA